MSAAHVYRPVPPQQHPEPDREPDPEHEPPDGTGFGAFILVLIAVGMLATTACADPGAGILCGLVGLCVLGSVGGSS